MAWAAYLSALMLFSAWSKFADPRSFRLVLGEYQLMSRTWNQRLVTAIPTLECALGAVLLIQRPWASRGGMIGVLAFLGVVSIIVALRLARGETTFRCGCHGDLSRPQSARLLLVRNAGLGAITLLAIPYVPFRMPGLPAVLSGVGFFALTQLAIAVSRAREAEFEWKALG